jgi:ABC-2 type transport system permease protein
MISIGWRWAAFKNGLRDATFYRAELILDLFTSAFIPIGVAYVLWHSVFIVGGHQEVGGYTYQQILSYTLVSALFSQVRGGNHDFDLQEMIRTGQLSLYLLRPADPVSFVYFRGVAPRIMGACVSLLVAFILSFFYDLSFLRVVGGMFLALLGNVIHYQVGAILAAVAFYWEESYSLLMVKNILVAFLSGETLPLDFFPTSWHFVWKSLPFHLYVYGPAQYSLGRWSHYEYGMALLIALLWLLVLRILTYKTWSIGIRRYTSIGG